MPESDFIKITDDNDDIISKKHKDTNLSQKSSKNKRSKLTFPFGACRVCSDSATGIHYGIATCEGCKGFFKRSILRKEKYRCYFDNACIINVANRNRCKACRFRQCINQGMSVDGVKMGRIPKLVKERALKELKEQKMKEMAPHESNEAETKQSLCSSSSNDSGESFDPNTMETDSIEERSPNIQIQDDSTNGYINNEYDSKSSSPSSSTTTKRGSINDQQIESLNNSNISAVKTNASESSSKNSINMKLKLPSKDQEQENEQFKYRTKYPTFLPNDFTVDETDGIHELPTGLLNNQELQLVKTIVYKLNRNQLVPSVKLTDEEARFIRYLRSTVYDIYLRRSRRLKQLISRMNQMIENNIQEYPGDKATVAEYFQSIGLCCQVYTHGTVLYVQEIPGMRNLCVESLQKLLARRSFDWFMLRHHQLYNDNGECYLLAPNGFQCTRYWMRYLHGDELGNSIFAFCRRIRELDLNEQEFSVLLAYCVCNDDLNIEDQDILKVLKSCYRHAFYTQLCQNRGENKAKVLYNKTMEVLEFLVPITEQYEKEVASRLLEV